MNEGTFYLHIKKCEYRFNNKKKSKNLQSININILLWNKHTCKIALSDFAL